MLSGELERDRDQCLFYSQPILLETDYNFLINSLSEYLIKRGYLLFPKYSLRSLGLPLLSLFFERTDQSFSLLILSFIVYCSTVFAD